MYIMQPENWQGEGKMNNRDDSQTLSAYEAAITNLFTPWLNKKIPDGAWTTLCEKLSALIKEIIRNQDEKNKREAP